MLENKFKIVNSFSVNLLSFLTINELIFFSIYTKRLLFSPSVAYSTSSPAAH
jgi:hypothetical protein